MQPPYRLWPVVWIGYIDICLTLTLLSATLDITLLIATLDMIAITHTSWAKNRMYVFAELTIRGSLCQAAPATVLHYTASSPHSADQCILAVTPTHTQSDTRSEYRIWPDRKLTQGQSWIMGAVLRKVLADQVSSQSRFSALC